MPTVFSMSHHVEATAYPPNKLTKLKPNSGQPLLLLHWLYQDVLSRRVRFPIKGENCPQQLTSIVHMNTTHQCNHVYAAAAACHPCMRCTSCTSCMQTIAGPSSPSAAGLAFMTMPWTWHGLMQPIPSNSSFHQLFFQCFTVPAFITLAFVIAFILEFIMLVFVVTFIFWH